MNNIIYFYLVFTTIQMLEAIFNRLKFYQEDSQFSISIIFINWVFDVGAGIYILNFRKNKSIPTSLFGVTLSVLAYSKYFIEMPHVFKTGFSSFSYILLFFLNLAGLTILGYAILNWTFFRSKWK